MNSSRALYLEILVTLVASLVLAAPVAAQKGQGASVPRTLPDFSKVPEGDHIEYQEYGDKPVTFTSTTIYVLVPAIVTDKNGNPVSGLTQDAFRVLENGKEQKIVAFEEMKPTTAPVAAPEPAKNVFTNLPATPDAKPRRLVILAADLINTPFLDQALMRRAIISYLADNIDPDALYELVAIDSNGMQVIHEFTQDTAGLITGLENARSKLTSGDRIVPNALQVQMNSSSSAPAARSSVVATASVTGSSDPGASTAKINLTAKDDDFIMAMLAKADAPIAELQLAGRAASTLLAFQQIAQRVSGVGGRKSLVWITGGFPFSIDPGTASVDVSISFPAYQHTMHLLADQMISVYPVDARGLLGNQPEAAVHMTAKRTMVANSWLMDESARQREVLDTMRAFADLTGGRAFVNTNDTRGAIRRAASDGAHYYLLTYAVDKNNRRPGWRKITVKAPNYTMRARPGYFMTQATADPALMAQLDIDTALTSPFEYTGLPVRVALGAPSAAGDKRKVGFSMTMPPKSAQVDSADGNHLNVAIAYFVQTTEGTHIDRKGTSYNLHLDGAQLAQIQTNGVGYSDTLELAPGDYSLRVVVRDNITGRMGSVTARLALK